MNTPETTPHSIPTTPATAPALVEMWQHRGTLYQLTSDIGSVARQIGTLLEGANSVSWPNAFILVCTLKNSTGQNDGALDLVAINGPLSESIEDARKLLRHYDAEYLLDEEPVATSTGIATILMPKWRGIDQAVPDKGEIGVITRNRFDFSELFSRGVIYAEPSALAVATTWFAGVCLFVLGGAMMVIVIDAVTVSISLTNLATRWLYAVFFIFSFLFLIAAELARLILSTLDKANEVRASKTGSHFFKPYGRYHF